MDVCNGVKNVYFKYAHQVQKYNDLFYQSLLFFVFILISTF